MTKHIDKDQLVVSGALEHRGYSVLELKKVSEEQRLIEGIATSPEPDRMGDIIEPMGVTFKNPIPLLWQHMSSQPIGTARLAKPTEDGIRFVAQIARTDEPGTLKDRLDEAWQTIKLGLVRGISIGFRSIERSFMDDGGIRFLKTEVLELSAVTIPANSEASIHTIKAIDAASRKIDGDEQRVVQPPGGTGISKQTAAPKGAKAMTKSMTISEQISAFEATRAAKDARMSELMNKSAEAGETLDKDASEEYDGLEVDVKKIDEHLVRLRAREAANKAAARPVEKIEVIEKAAEPRSSVISVRRNIAPGIPFVRVLGAKYIGRMNHQHPADIAKQMWPDTPEVEMVLRAPVAAGNTTDTTWAAPLVVAENLASEFVALLREKTIIGRIPGITRVPFNIKIPRETTAASVNWVGEGAIKPVSSMAFDSITILFNKVAGIVPITLELMRFSNPAAEGLIRDSLINAITYLTDRDFLDPSKAEQTGVSPASITNSVTPITASGTTSAALLADLGDLVAAFTAANMGTAGLVFIMTDTMAWRIGMMLNALGQPIFPGMSGGNGTLLGFPVITSENIVATGGSPTDGSLIIAVRAQDILLADDGGVTIDVSTEASIQMDTAPDSPATASTVTVSAFQYNMVFIRAERFITWKKRRTGCVQYIQNAKYE